MKKIFLFITAFILLSPSAHAFPVQWPDNGHYYDYINIGGTLFWENAKADAESKGGYLATVTSVEEDDWIWVNVAHEQYIHAWLGGFQPLGSPEPDGGWMWVTGEPWNYTHWYLANGEPNNHPANDPNGESVLELGRFLNAPRDWNDIDPHTNNCTDQCIPGYIIEWDSDPNASAIPEPASILLLGGGLIGAFLRKRKI